ncbi:hypothetical protein PInf_002687 [Phytophthora infestans]|nr:hypothetical protein PInf_002661 [Phytophthora infestans]KAI9998307.1 hypothetical protein PInf_002687 [Phytophthora infestans]
MCVLKSVFLVTAIAATVSASPIDDEISKLQATIVKLEAIKEAEANNKEALKLVSTAAMASSSTGSDSSAVTAGDTSHNTEFDIEPQPTRATTEAPSAESASASQTTSSTSSGSVEATTSASAASASASASASSNAFTLVPSALALMSAVVYAIL